MNGNIFLIFAFSFFFIFVVTMLFIPRYSADYSEFDRFLFSLGVSGAGALLVAIVAWFFIMPEIKE